MLYGLLNRFPLLVQVKFTYMLQSFSVVFIFIVKGQFFFLTHKAFFLDSL